MLAYRFSFTGFVQLQEYRKSKGKYTKMSFLMSSTGVFSITEINAFTRNQFEWIFDNIVEFNKEAALSAATFRPFKTVAHVKQTFSNYLDLLDLVDKKHVLTKYPELIQSPVDINWTSVDSLNEHKSAGLHAISQEDKALILYFLTLYRNKFHFPFVMCVIGHDVTHVLVTLQSRIHNSVEIEVYNGIEEVKKIAFSRIDRLVWQDTSNNI